jgi:hypothetical protein
MDNGRFNHDLDVTIDLEQVRAVRELKSTFMQIIGPGVISPIIGSFLFQLMENHSILQAKY